MSKRHFVTALLLAFLATFAEAAIHDKNPVGGYDCASDMTTDNCFGPTPTGSNGPTVTACIAFNANNQKCRDCMPGFDSRGEELGYNTCNYVRYNAACDCKPSGGSRCTSNTTSSCSYRP
jgi:hypothetical protein